MVLALDCGHAVNPHQIAAQVEGSVAYGLTATMFGENTVKDGRMVETNFHDYRILRLAEFPKVENGAGADDGLLGRRGRAHHLRGRPVGA
jgi:isoquinoline 1-oxidoreductase beta subunit